MKIVKRADKNSISCVAGIADRNVFRWCTVSAKCGHDSKQKV